MHKVTDNDIGCIYGCYKIIGIAKDRISPCGQIKKYYRCQCIKCGNKVELNAYKVRNNNYNYCKQCKPKQKRIKGMVGKKFGKLVVVDRATNNIQPNCSTKVIWVCKCDCGNIVNVADSHLKSGHTQSCGCYHSEKMKEMLVKDLSGNKYGKLTAVKKMHIKNGRQYWYCKCDCGNTCVASSVSLTSGKKKSCGCLTSVAEFELEQHLKKVKVVYRRQYKIFDCIDKRPLPFDFAIFNNDKLVMLIELNGQQHYYPYTYCGESKEIKIKNLNDRKRKDNIKQQYCKRNNIPLLTIKYSKFNEKNKIFDQFYQNILGGNNMNSFNAAETKDRLVQWIRDWFKVNGRGCNAVVGISGGKDSSVVAALCVEALGKNRVIGVMMPHGVQSDIEYSQMLCNHLGIENYTVNIFDACRDIKHEIRDELGGKWSKQSATNLPARIRMATLYAFAQSMNGRVSCNCNLSEDWVGYATYGGDGFGSFAPLADLTVTEVKAIGKVLGLPTELIEKTPTDGLCGKTDEDNLGFTYEVLDEYIRTGDCKDKAVRQIIDEMHEKNVFKLAPMPKFISGMWIEAGMELDD